ncbi:MAG: hypothetical protein WBG41_10320 [Acidimicrobiales bacterium]
MGQVDPGSAGLVVATVGSRQLEIVAVGAAVLFAVLLVVVKLWFSHAQRLRKAASSGYHQHDLAHYTPRGVEPETEPSDDPRSRPLAPTFAAPTAGARPGRAGEHHVPSPAAPTTGRRTSPFGVFDPTADVVRAFDTAEAQRLRPPTQIPPALVQPAEAGSGEEPPEGVPDLDGEEEIPPPEGALPLLQQPAPPPEPEKHSSAG